ncbi:MAG: tetratricopeptide repeat protein [candidate division NC10 bacterium]|jgi:tetratricopeptide (TPR) repeat protein
MARLSIEDGGIFQLLVRCPMRGLLITVPECQACPYHGGITKERQHFPDDSYITGYIECRYIDEMAQKHYERGWALVGQRLYNHSAWEWREALRLKPDVLDQDIQELSGKAAASTVSGTDRLLLAHLLYVRGDCEAAIEQLNILIDAEPDHGEAHWVRGLLHLSQEQWDNAQWAFDRAQQVAPIYRVQRHLVVGEAFYRRGQLDAALQECLEALALSPEAWQQAQAHATVGLVHHRRGALEEASAAYREAIHLDPMSSARVNLAAAYFDHSRYREAERTTPPAMPYLSWAIMYDRLHPLPNSAGRRFLLGAYYHQAGLLEEAIRTYDEALQLRPEFPHPHLPLARAHQARGEVTEFHDHMGSYHRLRDELDAAITEHREAVRLRPTWARARFHLALAYRVKGLMAEAVTELREAARLDPGNAEFRRELGAFLTHTRESRPGE